MPKFSLKQNHNNMAFKILTINPGSTSTKVALFEDDKQVFLKKIQHSVEEINKFPSIASQFSFRKDLIMDELKNGGIDISSINCIVGRGGLVKPIESGIYEVNAALVRDLENPVMGEHASNLGGLIAQDIAKAINNGAKAYIADPVVVDEMEPIARISGHPAFERVSIFHALNQKAIARTYAKDAGKKYEDLNLIVAHLGGGISVSAHCKGRVIDTNNALNGDGPFSPERSGTLPAGALVELCFSGKKTKAEINKMICGQGGLVGYLNSNNVQEIVEKNDPEWTLILDAMSYQIAKEIGAIATVFKGNVDAIILTGGVAYNEPVNDHVVDRVKFIAPVKIYPGEDEMRALAINGLMVLKGDIQPKVY